MLQAICEMKIHIKAFGIAKDILGAPMQELELTEHSSVIHVKEKLTSMYPEFQKLRKFSIAVNESYQDDDFLITEGDELVIIPPVSGG